MKTTQPIGSGGFTLVEIMIVVAIIGLLAAIAIPNFVRARSRSQATACISNLRQIDNTVQQLAIEKGLSVGDVVVYPDDLLPFIKVNSAGTLPQCPANGTYTLSPVGAIPQVTCSLSTLALPHRLE